MRAEDIFWFNESHLNRIGEEGRKKLIKLIQGMDKEPTPKRMSEKQLHREEVKRKLLITLERHRKSNVAKLEEEEKKRKNQL